MATMLKHTFRTASSLRISLRSYSAAIDSASKPSSHYSLLLPVSAALLVAYATKQHEQKQTTTLEALSLRGSLEGEETTAILNWSGTHAVQVSNKDYYEPETVESVIEIIAHCHRYGRNVRPCGSALSPNGIAFQKEGMMSLAHLDRIVNVDPHSMTVTVQAGARVSQVVEALRPHNMTLPNLASIAEQQMGGFVQVGAHGTGRSIAPVDHYVTQLKLVTPAKGLVTLTEQDGEIFHLAKVGLGCLGVLVEVTMKCIPAHQLVEHTYVLSRDEAKQQLDALLKRHKHLRYMWIPYVDAVVVVTNDPENQVANIPKTQMKSEQERLKPFHELLMELTRDFPEPHTAESLKGMGFGELRDAILAIDPLNVEHVKRCNQAEADFWRKSEGYQVKPSDQLLQFDCGGQQWVWEVCFPTGTQDDNNGNDMHLMDELLQGIEEKGVPAHSPIEQRWSASSSSLMSPAHGPPGGLHSWVGIINYLPTDDPYQRRAITELFTGKYCDLLHHVGQGVNATSHWAKLEQPSSIWRTVDLQLFLQSRYPLHKFNDARRMYDPKNILSNPLIDLVLGGPKGLGESQAFMH